ncbi:MAG TPA: 2-amino-4-hydroxy-6-hydroxymethyldihydropteridine diphosphokinase [Phycisphaerae bacterium]|nr:2-amino-4-hydroxy-6-hydroxymethyldihydropteridine diphosphokinase [Phycisphaerae bacterium]
MPTVCLGLGSNLGDCRGHLEAALAALAAQPSVRVVAVSTFIETEPVGGPPGQPNYLNGAAVIETALAPRRLLALVKGIERDLGRREGPRWGPREIDLDILLFGDTVLESADLTIPHARLRERRFVLAPLCEIAPDAVDPVTGLTVRQLLARLPREG